MEQDAKLDTCIISKEFKSVYDKLFYKRFVQQEWGSAKTLILGRQGKVMKLLRFFLAPSLYSLSKIWCEYTTNECNLMVSTRYNVIFRKYQQLVERNNNIQGTFKFCTAIYCWKLLSFTIGTKETWLNKPRPLPTPDLLQSKPTDKVMCLEILSEQ